VPKPELMVANGEIDILGVLPLVNWIKTTTGPAIFIDASQITFMDSSGLRALLVAKAELDAEERSLRLLNPSPAVERLFEIAGVSFD
jgi:anti-anti-sigma factor